MTSVASALLQKRGESSAGASRSSSRSGSSRTTNNEYESNDAIPGPSTSSSSAVTTSKGTTTTTTTTTNDDGKPLTAFKTPALPLKQRRVSLALPSSPRVVKDWSFRDDTAVQATSTAVAAPVTTRKTTARKLDEGNEQKVVAASPEKPEKKARKKWSVEETAMLVAGCNKHGVGNWKTILRDPTLKFDNRSPVDLKDRFRTYYPDAYRHHYPNAKTHLSNKVRSTLPDGKPLFEKTRSKRRRPFTEEEDRALKEGYEKYGTVWATIVKDYPIFQEQNRRSTDLRDRFRNAFPELYSLAGYKPRNAAKKKMAAAAAAAVDGGSAVATRRAATDEQLGTTSTGGPVRSRRRAYTTQGMLRGGTKSVPQSTACTEDEASSGGEEEVVVGGAVGMSSHLSSGSGSSSPQKGTSSSPDQLIAMPYDMVEDSEDMDMITMDPLAEALSFPDLLSGHDSSHSQHAWSSGVSTPTHSNHWSTAAGSPTSSHLSSDMLMNHSHASSPFLQHRSGAALNNNNVGMIGKSAWGTDWFSPNPRLDPSSGGGAMSPSSYLDHHQHHHHHQQHSHSHQHQHQQHSHHPQQQHHQHLHHQLPQHDSPASPFSFNQLNHGVLDRYDLFPTTIPSDFSSEVGVGDSHSTSFSDELLFQPSGFRGFTHHSSYAGDLIFGARTHQPVYQHHHHQSFGGLAVGGGDGVAGGPFGFGSLGLTGLLPFASLGGQQQTQSSSSSNSQQAGVGGGVGGGGGGGGRGARGGGSGADGGADADPLGVPLPPESMDEDLREEDVAMEDVSGEREQQQKHAEGVKRESDNVCGTGAAEVVGAPATTASSSLMAEPFSLDDLVDLSPHDHEGGAQLGLGGLHGLDGVGNGVGASGENHETPPATPNLAHAAAATVNSPGSSDSIGVDAASANGGGGILVGTVHPRPVRRGSSGSMLHQFPSPGSLHARSVSVPPSEYRHHPVFFGAHGVGGYDDDEGEEDDGEFEGLSGVESSYDEGGEQLSMQQLGQRRRRRRRVRELGVRRVNLSMLQQGPQPSISQQLENALGGQQVQGTGQGIGHRQRSAGGRVLGASVDGDGTVGRRRGRGVVLSSPSSPMGLHAHRSLAGLGLDVFQRGDGELHHGHGGMAGVQAGGRGGLGLGLGLGLFGNDVRDNGVQDDIGSAGGVAGGNELGGEGNGGNDDDDDEDLEDPRPQTPTLASSRQLLMTLSVGAESGGGAASATAAVKSGEGLSSPLGIATSISSSSTASRSSSSSSVASGSSASSRSQLSPVSDDGWRSASFGGGLGAGNHLGMGANAADIYNLPFLDLHYYGGTGGGLGGGIHAGHPSNGASAGGGSLMHGGGGSGLVGGADDYVFGGMDVSSSQTGALDLASSTGVSGGVGFGGFAGLGGGGGGAKGGMYLGQHGGIGGFMDFGGHSQHGLSQQLAFNHHGTGVDGGAGGADRGNGSAGIFKAGGLGRSHSHHRGQSHSSVSTVVGAGGGVDPRDLMMHSGLDGNKRKRASWDGRQA